MFYVEYSEEDKEYVGLCDKYPYLSYLHKNKCVAYLGIICATIAWGLSFIWTKSIFIELGPFSLALFRLLLSAIFIFLYVIIGSKFEKIKNKRDLLNFLFLAFAEPFCYFIGESFGVSMISSTLAAVIITTIPLFSPIAAFYFFKERITLVNVAGIFVSIFGVILVILKPDLTFAAEPIGLICLAFAVATAVISSIILAAFNKSGSICFSFSVSTDKSVVNLYETNLFA